MQHILGTIFFLLLTQISFGNVVEDFNFKSLEQRIVTINEDKYVFHWVTKDDITYRTQKEFSLEVAYEYINKTIKYGQDKGNHHGLYFAMDPIVSLQFGNFGASVNKWVLIAYKIPKGTRLLDSVSNLELSSKEKRWFKKRGCPTKSLKDFGQFTQIIENDCALAFNDFYKIKKISGIIYSWEQEQLPFCAPFDSKNQAKAIILRNTDAIGPRDIFILDSSRNILNDNLIEVKKILNTYASIFTNVYKVEELSFPEETSLTYEETKQLMINCN